MGALDFIVDGSKVIETTGALLGLSVEGSTEGLDELLFEGFSVITVGT